MNTDPHKKIIIPIYSGTRARNFFRNDTYRELIKDRSITLVVAIPSVKLDFYTKEFQEPNLIFEPFDVWSESWFGRLLAELAFNLFNTETVRLKQRLEYYRYKNYPRFVLVRVLNIAARPFFPVVRGVIRFFERLVPVDPAVESLLKKHNPNLVVLPDIVF